MQQREMCQHDARIMLPWVVSQLTSGTLTCVQTNVFLTREGERQHWHQQVLNDAALDTQKLVIGMLMFILANLCILDL